ncbi:MAG: subclass B1 metallo-beta-lactamase [Acidobacteriota bacterium]
MIRQLFLGFLILVLSPARPSPAEGSPAEPTWLNEDLMVEEIAEGVWRHVSYATLEEYGRTPANGLLVLSAGSAALIDTPWTGAQTNALAEWASGTLSAKLEVVVATHSHEDCAGGLAAAHKLGAVSYASAKTAEFARREGNVVPQNTFTEPLKVELGGRTLTLHHVGGGHTVDNSVVWIPDAEVLFGGCLVRSGTTTSLGYTGQADLVAWPQTIETVWRLYGAARIVVPGHGSPGGHELLENTLALLEQHATK